MADVSEDQCTPADPLSVVPNTFAVLKALFKEEIWPRFNDPSQGRMSSGSQAECLFKNLPTFSCQMPPVIQP